MFKRLAKIICQAITWLSDSQMQQVTEEVRSVVQSLYNIHEALRQMIVDKVLLRANIAQQPSSCYSHFYTFVLKNYRCAIKR